MSTISQEPVEAPAASAADEGLARADARRNREAVIEAGLVALAADPNASMADIAATAGLGRTTVYRHFASREELIEALFVRVVEEAQEATQSVIEDGAGVEATLRALGPAMVEIGERFRFLHAHLEHAIEIFAESKEIPSDPVRLFLLEARAGGHLRPDAPIEWMQAMMQSTAMGTMDEVRAGRLDPTEAGRLLGDAFVATFLRP